MYRVRWRCTAEICTAEKLMKMQNSWATRNPQRLSRENRLYWDICPGCCFPRSLRIMRTLRPQRQIVVPKSPTSSRTRTVERLPQSVDCSDLRAFRAVSAEDSRDLWLADETRRSEPKSTNHMLSRPSGRRAAVRLMWTVCLPPLMHSPWQSRTTPEFWLVRPARWLVRNSIGRTRRRRWWSRVRWVEPNFIPISSETSPSRTAFLLSARLNTRTSRLSHRPLYVSENLRIKAEQLMHCAFDG